MNSGAWSSCGNNDSGTGVGVSRGPVRPGEDDPDRQ